MEIRMVVKDSALLKNILHLEGYETKARRPICTGLPFTKTIFQKSGIPVIHLPQTLASPLKPPEIVEPGIAPFVAA